MEGRYRIVMTTSSSRDVVQGIIEALLTQKLAACVQMQEVDSHYVWQEKLCHETEYLLFIKTPAGRYSEVESAIVAHHDYETPEILEVPISGGFSKYLAWMDEVCGTDA